MPVCHAGAVRTCVLRTRRANRSHHGIWCRICAGTWRQARRPRCTARPLARKHCGHAPPAMPATTYVLLVCARLITSPTCVAISSAKANCAARRQRPCKKCNDQATRGVCPHRIAWTGPKASACPRSRIIPASMCFTGLAVLPRMIAAR